MCYLYVNRRAYLLFILYILHEHAEIWIYASNTPVNPIQNAKPPGGLSVYRTREYLLHRIIKGSIGIGSSLRKTRAIQSLYMGHHYVCPPDTLCKAIEYVQHRTQHHAALTRKTIFLLDDLSVYTKTIL